MLDQVKDTCNHHETFWQSHSWQDILALMDKALLADDQHVRLVRALDYALATTPELMVMEREHAEWIADYFARLLRHYGSRWPKRTRLNTGRLIYNLCSIYYYSLDHLSARDQRDSRRLFKFTQHNLVEQALNLASPGELA